MSEPKGQILPGTEFGDLLTKLASQCETILEIGTWHGLGSTQCLSEGLVRPTQRMWTVDPSFQMWKEARSYYPDEPRIRFLNAKTIDVLDEIPNTLDMVLFDGDDHETDDEFAVLIERITKFVALDDTNERKNYNNRDFLLHKKWKIIADVKEERNGWAVFERV